MAAAPSSVPRHDLQRVSRREPCPICRKPDGCEIRADGAVNCIRVDSPNPSNRLEGHWHRLPVRGDGGRIHHDATTFAPRDATPPPAEPPMADADTRHAVYTALLELCPLSPADRAHLLSAKRQIAPARLGAYGTLPPAHEQAPIIAQLIRRGYTPDLLLTVPGFVEDQTVAGGLRLAVSGLLCAARDAQGRIQAFQVRQTRGSYPWLSSKNHGGPSSGAPAHVARPCTLRTHRVCITEGILKADIAAEQLGAIVVSVPGHGNWATALAPMEALQAEGYDVAVVALDSDDPAKQEGATVRAVEGSGLKLAAALAAMGYAVRLARWPHEAGKGLDDLLLAGGTFALEVYHAQAATSGADADSDEHAAGLDPGPLTDSRKLSILSNVLLNKTMKPTDKVVLCVMYLLAGTWPGTQAPTEDGRRKPMTTIAGRANLARGTTSRIVASLKSQGLADYSQRTEMPPPLPFPRPPDAPLPSAAPRTVTYFRPARPLGFDEELPPAEHRAVDRARKRRCPSCGSLHLVESRLLCKDCDSTCTVAEAEQAAADYERAAHTAPQDAPLSGEQAPGPAEPEPPAWEPAESPPPPACSESERLSESGRDAKWCADAAGSEEVPWHEMPPCSEFIHGDVTPPPAPSVALSPTAEALIAGLRAHRYPGALARDWHWLTDAGGRRYHGLPPDERAAVDAAYTARMAALCADVA